MTNFLVLGPGCGGNFWFNGNIAISTGVLNVAQPTTISITVKNTNDVPVRLNDVQATVCAFNTLHSFNSAAILPSLKLTNPLVWDNTFPFPNDLVIPAGGSATVQLPTWTPQAGDIHHFDNVPGAAFENLPKTSLHVCIFANCTGSFPPVMTGAVTDDGALVNWNSAVSGSFCSDTHHGQLNTSLHRLSNQFHMSIPFYAGSAGEREFGKAKVFLREVAFDAPAHGRSDGRDTTLLEISDVILRLASDFGPVHAVIAHSFGVPCVLFALQQQRFARRVVAFSTPATLEGLVEKFAGSLALSPRTVQILRDMLVQRFGEDVWTRFSVQNMARSIGLPALVIHDRDDRDVPWQEGDAVARAWPHARFLRTEGLGHRRILRDPEVIDRVVRFLEPSGARDRAVQK